MNDEATSEPPPQSFFFIFPSVMLPMFLAVIDQTIVASALPAIAASTGGVERVSWIVVAYLLATTVAAPIYGSLRDAMGGKLLMLLALAIFMIASALCAAATSIEMMALCRVLQGLGGGGLMTLSQALIGEAVPPRERARYQGYLAAVAVTSSTLGPVIGGALTEHFGWRSIFLVNIPVGIIAIFLTLRLPSRPVGTQSHRFDWSGLAWFVLFIVPAILAVEQLPSFQIRGLIFALAMAGLAALGLRLLLRREASTPHPLFDLDLLRRPAIWQSSALAACHGAALVSLISFLPIYFHIQFGMSASQTGLLLLPMMFGIGIGSMVTGRLVGRTGQTMIFPSFGLIVTVFLVLQLSLWADRLREPYVMVLLFLLGLSMGTVMGVVQITMQTVAGRDRLGAAASTVQVARSIGAATGTAVVGAVLFATLAFSGQAVVDEFHALVREDLVTQMPTAGMNEVRMEILHAFRVAFFTIAMFVGSALLLAWTHPHRRI